MLSEMLVRSCCDPLILAVPCFSITQLDGADPENKNKRDFLFTVSKEKAYPQVFLESEGSAYKYVGTWDAIQELLDSSDIPEDVLAAHPEIKTFNKVSTRLSELAQLFPCVVTCASIFSKTSYVLWMSVNTTA